MNESNLPNEASRKEDFLVGLIFGVLLGVVLAVLLCTIEVNLRGGLGPLP